MRERFSDREDIEVILDRRLAERRRRELPVERERRTADRRRRPDIDARLRSQSHAFVIIHEADDRGGSERWR